MSTCSNSCAAVTPGAGTGFIFRGGDTWSSSNYFVINSGGTSSAPVYYGVDQNWSNGSPWNRPIFAINGALPNVSSNTSHIFMFNAPYVTVDNFEITGATCAYNTTAQDIFNPNGQQGVNILNNYIHAMQPPAGGCGNSGVTGSGNAWAIWVYDEINNSSNTCKGYFEYNVVDGTDGSGAKGYEAIIMDPNACPTIAYNVTHDICSGYGGNFTLAHDNLIYNFGQSGAGFDCTYGASGDAPHVHALRANGDATLYNNVVHDTASEAIMVNPKSGGGRIEHLQQRPLP